MERELDLRCSFCGKAPDGVDQMIATHKISQKLATHRYATSLKAAICDECVRLSVEILKEAQAIHLPRREVLGIPLPVPLRDEPATTPVGAPARVASRWRTA